MNIINVDVAKLYTRRRKIIALLQSRLACAQSAVTLGYHQTY